jgi:hypothetical protein
MKYVIFSCLFLLSLKQEGHNTITWSEDRSLRWEDFKAKPNPEYDALALTASGITFSYSVSTKGETIVDFETKVEAHFYPDKSWYIKEKGNNRILKHEQLHFDITELCVRQFRSAISDLKISQDISVQLERLHTAINDEVDRMQKQYDIETNHSMDAVEQKRWEEYILKQLQKYEAFKSR